MSSWSGISLGGMYSTSGTSSSSSWATSGWWILTLGRRMRGLSFCVFPAEERGAGVAKALDLALVVFMPSGARVRGPKHVSCRFAQPVVSSRTGWRNKGICVYLAARLGGKEVIALALGVSCSADGIFVVERDLEWRLGGFVSGCFGVEALEAGIERLSCSGGVQMADGVLLVVCCERSHYGGCIERVVGGVVIPIS
jgi:hypothetical protein